MKPFFRFLSVIQQYTRSTRKSKRLSLTQILKLIRQFKAGSCQEICWGAPKDCFQKGFGNNRENCINTYFYLVIKVQNHRHRDKSLIIKRLAGKNGGMSPPGQSRLSTLLYSLTWRRTKVSFRFLLLFHSEWSFTNQKYTNLDIQETPHCKIARPTGSLQNIPGCTGETRDLSDKWGRAWKAKGAGII